MLEAKSEKSADGFTNCETQTAFAIRTLLKLQNDLKEAAGNDSQWETGPLVWFLMNRGEEWRVAAAYYEKVGDTQRYVRTAIRTI